MRRTLALNPTSERIVEDMTRYPLVIDKIIEHKGGVVPDFTMQHAGCSKRKRKGRRRAHGSTCHRRRSRRSPRTAARRCVKRLSECVGSEWKESEWGVVGNSLCERSVASKGRYRAVGNVTNQGVIGGGHRLYHNPVCSNYGRPPAPCQKGQSSPHF